MNRILNNIYASLNTTAELTYRKRYKRRMKDESEESQEIKYIHLKFLQWKPQQDATVYQSFIIPYFKWSSACFGRHTAHHQEPKTAQAASGFAYVEGCRTCSCWTLSDSIRYLMTSNNSTSNNLPRMQNKRLLVQFWAPDDGQRVSRNMLSFI